ncbi:MAG TPA: hypothetical protein ENI87_08500 [bacterium]|nr:hypothetical protein [bacterium]
MTDLDPDTIASLTRYGFDPELQARWQRLIADGTFAKANNVITDELSAPPAGSIHELPPPDSDEFRELHELGLQAIGRGELAVCVLNGGMATRFGGVVKGVVEVRDGLSFLGLAMHDTLAVARAAGGRIPVYLMNSFATDDATKDHFAEHDDFGVPADDLEHFTQFVALRATRDGQLFRRDDGSVSPYGPGHGDFAAAFRAAGCLERLRNRGGKYVFVRNVDNLGARVSPAVLGHHIRSGCEMTAEQAPKWEGDVGGAPYLVAGRVQLVEGLRYPDGFDAGIVDVFNCNTMTFDAAALARPVELGRYYVEKEVDGRKAVQIEHLIGEMTAHLTTNFLKIPRAGADSRFLPIKAPRDLSDARAEIDAIYGR